MSMLFLFENEIERYHFLDKEIIDKMDTRIAVEKTDMVYHLEYLKRDLELDAGWQYLTQEEYLKKYIDSKDLRYVSQEWELLELDDKIRIKAPLYKVQQDYIDMIDELDILKQRDAKAYNFFNKYDYRNLYVSDGCLYLGHRLKNEDDPRMIGELASGEMLMDKEEYTNFLQSIKDQV
jgi:hypothetical protein